MGLKKNKVNLMNFNKKLLNYKNKKKIKLSKKKWIINNNLINKPKSLKIVVLELLFLFKKKWN